MGNQTGCFEVEPRSSAPPTSGAGDENDTNRTAPAPNKPIKMNSLVIDPNNNDRRTRPNVSNGSNGSKGSAPLPIAILSKLANKRNKPSMDSFLRDATLHVGHLAKEEIETRADEDAKKSQQRLRQLMITKPMWRESVHSLKPIDNVFRLGESRSGLKANFDATPQDFEKLKKQCQDSGTLFVDPVFPGSDASFYLHGRGPQRFKWLRPHEIVANPLFVSHGAERFDVMQGELGNCWLLAAVANLTLYPRHLERVVPKDQTFDKPDYAGIFHFRFWQYGKWIDVVIDDRLPTQNGRLMLMHSKDRNEFWSALLEKAYAKLHGSYESLKGGTTSEAMEDFTGGLTEHYEIQSEECPPNLFTVMLKAHQRHSFMGCSIAAVDSAQMEAVLSNGLIKGHAYSITSVKLVQIDHFKVQGKIPLVRIRNPWGNEAEWSGAWSDKSREWSVVSDAEKRALGLSFDADGEFWMSFADFKKCYTNIEITNLTPDALDDDEKRRWEVNYFEGQWIPGVSAGGCRNNIDTFHMNPQYMITLTDFDDEDDEDLCTCVVALMQKNHRIKRKMGLDNLTIGFAIYEVKDDKLGGFAASPRLNYSQVQSQSQLLTTNFFRYNQSVARSASFINLREISGRFRLKPGRYCIIPSTFDPNKKGDFMIRFFTEKPAKNVMENDETVSAVTDEDDNDNKENGPETAPKALSPGGDAAEDRTDTERSAFAFFQKIAGADHEVDALELQQVMNHVFKKELKFQGFSIESCRSMVALMDLDESGKLGFDEFIQLWRNLRNWCEVFKKHDTDSSSTINAGELRDAFREVGINVNRQILRLLVNRYGHRAKASATIEDQMYFDDFIYCSLKMKRCIEVWNNKKARPAMQLPGAFSVFARGILDRPPAGAVHESSFTLDEFMRNVLYS